MTIGSLFDGSGGFPLGSVIAGIEPLWASEIEPYPLKVTAARFPHMKQLGDVTKINGAEIDPVDIITFGSPCQDLSVAGKQAGIHEGTRSSLFFEAIRIIREMREETNGKWPSFAVWENVPGAFSSNGGEDFYAVLQALAETAGCEISVPGSAKWKPAGAIVADGWSIAWRVFDAQYWGVPQRRKRIYLVADFGGQRAGEILFEREGVRGNPAQSGAERQGTAADAERSAGRDCAGFAWANSGDAGLSFGETAPTIKAARNGEPGVVAFMGGQGEKARSLGYCDDGTCPTLRAASSGTNQVPDICYSLKGNFVDRETKQKGIGWSAGAMYTLDATDRHCVCYPEIARSLCARHDSSPCVDRGQNVVAIDCRNMKISREISGMLQAKPNGGQSLNYQNPILYRCVAHGELVEDGTCGTRKARDYKGGSIDVVVNKMPRRYIVRRLTPLECCRLQGFPDWWEDSVEGSDSARYKMWGNGVALPCVVRVMQGIMGKGVSKCPTQ